VRQGSPNTNALRSAPRRQRPDHRPSAAARAVEAERAEVRAWLHDRVLQSLEYLAAGGYADEPDARMLQRVAARAADELRAYVDGDAERAPGDLGAALDAVAADARMLAGEARIRLVVGPEAADLPALVVQVLAAATREALANVAKHARASRAIVRVDVVPTAVSVRIDDDGAGFDPGKTPFGAGLRHSVQDRLARLGGSATLQSAPGAGTCLTLTVPLETTNPAGVAA
jgi:signal transduction histidine kinase